MLLFFAGGESPEIRQLLYECGVRNILMSYYYILQRAVNMDEVLSTFDRVVVDSGAFTLGAGHEAWSRHKKEKTTSLQLFENWLTDYLLFLEKYKGRFYWAANLDLNTFVGDGIVYKWNDEFEKLERDGQRICYVSHDSRKPYRNLWQYFDRYKFIGVAGGIDSKGKVLKSDVGYFSQVYNLSVRYRKLVHGFAMTNFVSFDRFPLFTVDSTTYLGGVKFGTTYVYNGAYFETWDYRHKYRRKALKRQCEERGVDFDLFLADDGMEVTRYNIHSWLENEKLFNKKTKARQWWMN